MIALLRICVFGVLGMFLSASAVFANEPVERTNTTSLWFESWGSLYNATLKVSGPNEFLIEIFNEKGSPTFFLRDAAPVKDGVYRYELTAATTEMVKLRNPLNNGRGKAQKDQVPKPFSMGGFFFVERGVIAEKKDLVEE